MRKVCFINYLYQFSSTFYYCMYVVRSGWHAVFLHIMYICPSSIPSLLICVFFNFGSNY